MREMSNLPNRIKKEIIDLNQRKEKFEREIKELQNDIEELFIERKWREKLGL
jgi:predicted  nucleic acid-binding Zn-ribbon protein